jgi:hypothetical protein
VCRYVLGDAHDSRDAGVDRLIDGVGGEARRHEDEGRIRAGVGNGIGHGVEYGDALDVLATLAGRHPRDDVCPVVAVAKTVEATLASREALHDEAGVLVHDDRH